MDEVVGGGPLAVPFLMPFAGIGGKSVATWVLVEAETELIGGKSVVTWVLVEEETELIGVKSVVTWELVVAISSDDAIVTMMAARDSVTSVVPMVDEMAVPVVDDSPGSVIESVGIVRVNVSALVEKASVVIVPELKSEPVVAPNKKLL